MVSLLLDSKWALVNKINVFVFLSLVMVGLSGCESDMADINDRDLRQRNYECEMGTNLGVAQLQVCANIKRECDRRAKAGHYAC